MSSMGLRLTVSWYVSLYLWLYLLYSCRLCLRRALASIVVPPSFVFACSLLILQFVSVSLAVSLAPWSSFPSSCFVFLFLPVPLSAAGSCLPSTLTRQL